MKTTGKLIIFIFALLTLGANAYAADDSMLFQQVLSGYGTSATKLTEVEALIAKGADVNAKDKDGATPLHFAAGYWGGGKKDIAELLLAKGANVNAKDKDGYTPLVEAVTNDHKDIAELLLAKGADINVMGRYDRTLLMQACGNKDLVKLLLDKGADVNARNKVGQSPLFYVMELPVCRGDAKLLLAKGADANAKDQYGQTVLYKAVTSGDKDSVELLLTQGADVNAKNKGGETPLHGSNNKDIAELLLAKGADVNSKDELGFSPLVTALSRSDQLDIAALMENHFLKQTKNPRELFGQLSQKLSNKLDDNSTGSLTFKYEGDYSGPGIHVVGENDRRRYALYLHNQSTRRLIIKLASELKPAPAIPEEARKHFVEGTAIVKAAKNPAQQAMAAQSFTEALKIAPWWGDAYYNLGVAQELAENYDEAEQAFNFYLLSNPSEAENREVQDRIYGLSAKRKLAGAK